MTVHRPVVKMHDSGLVAEHDHACTVCGENPSVIQLGIGAGEATFQPCWECQGNGCRVVPVPRPLRWVLRCARFIQ